MKKMRFFIFTLFSLLHNVVFSQDVNAGTASAPSKKQPVVQAAPKGGAALLARGDCDADFEFTASETEPLQFDFAAVQQVPGFVYEWDFGDGNTENGPSAAHSYAADGMYTACLLSYKPGTNSRCEECYEVYAGAVAQRSRVQAKKAPVAAVVATATLAGGIKLSPNPAAGGQVSIAVNALEPGAYRITIFNLTGGVVASQQRSLPKGPQTLVLETGLLPAGRYVVQVGNNSHQWQALLVKL